MMMVNSDSSPSPSIEEIAESVDRDPEEIRRTVEETILCDDETGDHTYPLSGDVADVYFCHECSKEFFSEYVDRPECCPFCGCERVRSGGTIELGEERRF